MDLVRSIAFLIVALIGGLVGYQVGVSQNVAAQIPAGAAMPAYYYGPHMFGFGSFGFLFPVLFFFLFIALISAAIRSSRGWGGHGYGWDARRARFEQMHRELHGDRPSSGGSSSSA